MQLQNEFHLQPSLLETHWTRDVTHKPRQKEVGNHLELHESRLQLR